MRGFEADSLLDSQRICPLCTVFSLSLIKSLWDVGGGKGRLFPHAFPIKLQWTDIFIHTFIIQIFTPSRHKQFINLFCNSMKPSPRPFGSNNGVCQGKPSGVLEVGFCVFSVAPSPELRPTLTGVRPQVHPLGAPVQGACSSLPTLCKDGNVSQHF